MAAILRELLWLVAFVTLGPASILVHELGHAYAARRRGVSVREIVAAPEGPSVLFRRGGLVLRVGLGLGRDVRSTEPGGWVRLEWGRVDPADAIAVLAAGPIAEACFGVGLLALVAAPMSTEHRVLLAVCAVSVMASAAQNRFDRSHPGSDGAQIALVRRHLTLASERRSPSTWEDPNATTSVAPPGWD